VLKQIKTHNKRYGDKVPGGFIKGVSASPNTQFKKGLVPWNKNKIHLRGVKHPMWKGGFTKIKVKLRNHPRYARWRTAIFIRDNFTCILCGTKGEYLEVHHKKPFVVILREFAVKTLQQGLDCVELWDTTNGITLCQLCHRETESRNKNS
jgi:hypothetical protein